MINNNCNSYNNSVKVLIIMNIIVIIIVIIIMMMMITIIIIIMIAIIITTTIIMTITTSNCNSRLQFNWYIWYVNHSKVFNDNYKDNISDDDLNSNMKGI